MLDETQWATLLSNLDRLAEIAAARGLRAVLHPHVGTMVENRAEVDRVLAGSRIPLCLDTGHLLIGGTDPLALTRQVPDRIEHAHLKDVNAALAAKVQSGELTYTQAVAAGMYVPLGAGDVDIAGIVKTLEDNGYDGWFVMEQDTILDGEPEGEGPLARRAWPAWRSCTAVTRDREKSADRRPGSVPDRRSSRSSGPPQELGHRLVAVAARDPHRAALSPKSTAWNGFSGPTRTCSTIPRSTLSTTRWPTHCTGRGIWRPCGPANRCSPKSRSPAIATRRARWPTAPQAAGVTVVEAFHYLYHPVTRRLLELIGCGDLGELRAVEVGWGCPRRADDPRWSLELAGGALMDLGCYGLHVMRTVGRIMGAAPRGRRRPRAVERDPAWTPPATSTCESVTSPRAASTACSPMTTTSAVSGNGSRGEALVHNFVKPQDDDRVTVRTTHGHPSQTAGHPCLLHLPTGGVPLRTLHGVPLPVDNADAMQNMALIDAAYRAAGMAPR